MKKAPRRPRSTHRFALALAYLGATSPTAVHLERVIDEHIERVLDATDHNLSTAAELLGMHRRSLQRYVRRRQRSRRKK